MVANSDDNDDDDNDDDDEGSVVKMNTMDEDNVEGSPSVHKVMSVGGLDSTECSPALKKKDSEMTVTVSVTAPILPAVNETERATASDDQHSLIDELVEEDTEKAMQVESPAGTLTTHTFLHTLNSDVDAALASWSHLHLESSPDLDNNDTEQILAADREHKKEDGEDEGDVHEASGTDEEQLEMEENDVSVSNRSANASPSDMKSKEDMENLDSPLSLKYDQNSTEFVFDFTLQIDEIITKLTSDDENHVDHTEDCILHPIQTDSKDRPVICEDEEVSIDSAKRLLADETGS